MRGVPRLHQVRLAALPVDFPPWQTVYWYFNQWEQAKITEEILPVVRGRLRIQEGRDPEPSAGRLTPSVRTPAATTPERRSTAGSGSSPTVTLGLRLCVVVLSAGLQDRDGVKPVLLETYLRTRVRFVFADGAFAGRLLDWATGILATTLNIVRKPADQRGFAVIPRRWAVERKRDFTPSS